MSQPKGVLVAEEASVTRRIQLGEGEFYKMVLSTGIDLIGGTDIAPIEKGDTIVVIGHKSISPKYGPQLRAVRWWPKNKCPFNSIETARQCFAFLLDDLKLGPRTAEKIFMAYLEKTITTLRENPYRVITDGFAKRIQWKEIDRIALEFGISKNDRRRLRAMIIKKIKDSRSLNGIAPYIDEEGLEWGGKGGGHIYLDFTQVAGLCADAMHSEEHPLLRTVVEDEVRALATEPRNPVDARPMLVVEKDQEGKNDRYVYLWSLHRSEITNACHIRRIINQSKDRMIQDPEIISKVPLTDEQRSAVQMALTSPLSIITGGPGVGKTTIISAVVDTLDRYGIQFALCAPTGIAARRMEAATNKGASTIHRLLAFSPVTGRFTHNHGNPLSAKFIICDESSMVDESLMAYLLDAIADDAQLLFVGDANQLPPVGPGAPFRSIILSKIAPSTRLTHIFRQDLANSLIIKGSRAVLEKKRPEFGTNTNEHDLFSFTYRKDAAAVDHILKLVTEKIPKIFGFQERDIQVLCPHKLKESSSGRINLLAAESLNEQLQFALRGMKPPEGQKFVIGDRVVQTRNDYNLEIMNGEIGYVTSVNSRKSKLTFYYDYTIEFEGRSPVTISHEEARNVDLAYAMSIHKAQGTQSPAVIVLAYGVQGFYSRNMFYTAMTRGKRVVAIVTPHDLKGIDTILRTDETRRNSRLVWRLQKKSVEDEADIVYEEESLDFSEDD